jgi:aryl-phospho-beta-D-glucosidase BglC (GH1 family)
MTGLLLATLVLAGASSGTVPAADAPGGVPPARLEKLTQGINLSHWFSQSHSYSKQHLETYNTARDAALIKAMGFRHVRFTFNEATVVDKEKPAVLNPEKMKRFETAIDMLLAAGLAVIVDFHPEEDYKRAVEKDAAALENFVGMWRALARRLSSRDPERIFFEVMNEPVMRDSARWNVIQKEVLAAMRESAPRHTLIAAAAEWSEIYKLEFVEVVADRNVVYNFHCYEPFKFTHQGATWAGPSVKGLKNVPYPSSPAAVAKVLADLPDEKTRQLMIKYGEENWNAEKIDAFIARAAAWGRKHGVALTCNEFGVYRVAPAADRNRCIADVRKALEKYHIGWCMWDYAGAFGVATGEPGRRVPDADTVKALGLTVSAQEPPGRWSEENAWQWYNKQPWIVGFNFVTSSAVNDIDMWQADTFDLPNIERELKIAASLGYNTARVFINYHLWEADPAGLKKRMDQYLAIADRYGIRTVFCPFDYCNFTKPRRPPKLGKQGEPTGQHGGNWVESPWEDMARDPKKFPLLKRYITDVVGSFAHDKRVLMWDLYNEPMPPVWELTMACFDWAREARPEQPVTVGMQQHLNWQLARQIFERSDIVTYHLYGRADETRRRIEEIRKLTKHPLVCTEWLNTLPEGKTDIPTCLPIYKREKVGAICWGMMQGRIQTPIHDILRPDGTPIYPQDVEILRELTGAKDGRR